MNPKAFALGLISLAACLLFMTGCGKSSTVAEPNAVSGPPAITLTLDWKPEPEFGGFYAAQQNGVFTQSGLNVTIKPADAGADTWQLVATDKTEFATTAADQVMIARAHGADVIAIFAVYQTFPQGIMVHAARGFKTIGDVFSNDGFLLAEDDAWLHFLQAKYPSPKVKFSPYSGGIAEFLSKPDYSQQCFVTSEPILAKHQGGDPQTFLIADAGYNPYTTVVICKADLWKNSPDRVKAMVASCRAGWRAYLDDPTATNATMHGLNPDMDLQTFGEAATAQKPLIETDQTKATNLGTMTADRWNQLGQQLVDLKVIDKAPAAGDCFVNP
jgi:NitT/TauT family transport system substrate-binding protein